MPYFDIVAQAGTGSQASYDRWGDYSGIGVDPSDDCTFWFFGMYEEGTNNSATRIASFKFDQCSTCTAPGAPTLNSATATCSGVFRSESRPAIVAGSFFRSFGR